MFTTHLISHLLKMIITQTPIVIGVTITLLQIIQTLIILKGDVKTHK